LRPIVAASAGFRRCTELATDRQLPLPSTLPPHPSPLAAVWTSGIVQTIIYLDFFYYYVKSWKNNEKLALPP
jgi:hypothetical protein